MTSASALLPSTLKRAPACRAAIDMDATLMLGVRDGDAVCFATLLERHHRAVVRHLFRMVQNQAIAEELAQEVFLRVYRSRASYEASAKFTTWLFRISANVALNWLRDGKNERHRRGLADGGDADALGVRCQRPSVESVLVERVKLDEVRGAIARLPGNQRAAVLMHKYDELEYAEIARRLGSSESAVKSLLFRAYEKLRARLAHYG